MVELASQPGACVARLHEKMASMISVIFKWLRLCHNRRAYITCVYSR
ncbi:hypothetical protein [Escherichia coli]|nr:hypothetical protein [Escherichia coli]